MNIPLVPLPPWRGKVGMGEKYGQMYWTYHMNMRCTVQNLGHGMHYLLTWNCTHIAHAAIRSDIEDVCRAHGYEPPVICTPEELLET